MKIIYENSARVVASALIHTGPGILTSLLIGMDDTNDPVVSIHDALDGDTATNEIVPEAKYDASALGMGGVALTFPKKFTTGLYVKIASLGTGRVVVGWRSEGDMFPHLPV